MNDQSKPDMPKRTSKREAIIKLLRRKQGATMTEMIAATGWQNHSLRAALTGLRQKGHAIERTKRGDTTCYHIAKTAAS